MGGQVGVVARGGVVPASVGPVEDSRRPLDARIDRISITVANEVARGMPQDPAQEAEDGLPMERSRVSHDI